MGPFKRGPFKRGRIRFEGVLVDRCLKRLFEKPAVRKWGVKP
jgi:hypothetical protein